MKHILRVEKDGMDGDGGKKIREFDNGGGDDEAGAGNPTFGI